MLQLEWPWLLLAAVLPWLYRRLLQPADLSGRTALRVPSLEDFVAFTTLAGRGGASRWSLRIAILAWLCFVIAVTRPQWLGEAIELPVSGRDLMLAVDLSESMRQTDFVLAGKTVDRLTATKAVAEDFIERRVGDRVGLVLFGTQAYLHVPLTFDRETVRQLLSEAVIGLAGRNTAIGDAIGLAVKRLRENSSPQKVLILMTDGANTAGVIEPKRAAQLAADAGLTIHTIGIGADEMRVRRMFGSLRVNPSRDLDEETLKAIAESTGGRYFRAHDVEELEQIYAELDRLEPIDHSGEYFQPVMPLFPWPLGAALLLTAIVLWMETRPAP